MSGSNNSIVAFANPQDLSAQRLVFEIARALVQEHSTVSVEIIEQNGLRTLQVRTDADGVGRLIGSQGRTVRAIRTILTASASKEQQVYALDIREAHPAEVPSRHDV